ncbi:MAG: membrane protein insertase YidC [Alphaproteobacteria bacterium]|nr:MAG: membrane protein insertase YidC [Alphaproteobacteria bacterium]
MQDNKNLIVAFLVSLVILLVFDVLVMRPQREAAQQSMAEQAGDKQSPAQSGDGAVVPTLEGVSDVPQGGLTSESASRQEALNRSPRVAIETPRLAGSIALKGGRIDDLILTEYKVSLSKDAPPVTLLSPAGAANAYFADFGWVAAPGAPVKLPDREAVWTASGDRLAPGRPLTLTWNNGEGLVFTRTFEVDEYYMFTVTQSVRNESGMPLALAPYGLVTRHGTPETSRMLVLHEGPLAVFGEELAEIDYEDLRADGKVERDATGGWLGFTDKYWLTALIPNQDEHYRARFIYRQKDGLDRYQSDFLLDPRQVQPGEAVTVSSRLFAGAKVVELLDQYENRYQISRFDLGVDWGWFYWITKPIFYTLHYLNEVLGNFGLAILALTVLLKLLFFPLANKSYMAMSKMKLLQPKMVELKERYGDDRVRLQQEMMELYRKEQVNPLAGCLPILVQIPVFFALYKVLFVTIEMRHAPFYGWVRDLSAPDTLTPLNLFGLIPWDPPSIIAIGVWPILMGLTMYLQQKLNPAPQDPVQAKVMAFLPLIFTFILAQFAVGLVIYWTWNNVLSIAQQWVIMKRMGVPVEVK